MSKNKLKPIVITMSILIIVCFAALAINVFDGFSIFKIPPLMSYVMAFLYLLVLYKKPHGNDIKIMYMIYATFTAIGIDSGNAVKLGRFLIPVCIVLIALWQVVSIESIKTKSSFLLCSSFSSLLPQKTLSFMQTFPIH